MINFVYEKTDFNFIEDCKKNNNQKNNYSIKVFIGVRKNQVI